MPTVEARDLRFRYRPDFSLRAVLGLPDKDAGREALRGVSLDVREGEVYGILGPNGAGKTTLLKTLATILVPTSGTIRVFGLDPEKEPAKVRERLGVSLGEFERTFQFRLSGRKNLEFHAAFLGLTRAEARARALATLEEVGLAEASERMFLEYSTGMKQRLALARALLNEPRLLILDEPTAGLDANSSRALGDVVKKLASRGVAVVYSTHRLEEAGRLCDRILVLKQGAPVTEAAPSDIRRLYQDVEVVAFRAPRMTPAAIADVRSLPFVKAVVEEGEFVRVHVDKLADRFYDLAHVLEKHDVKVEGVRTEEPGLADAFVRLTGGEHA